MSFRLLMRLSQLSNHWARLALPISCLKASILTWSANVKPHPTSNHTRAADGEDANKGAEDEAIAAA